MPRYRFVEGAEACAIGEIHEVAEEVRSRPRTLFCKRSRNVSEEFASGLDQLGQFGRAAISACSLWSDDRRRARRNARVDDALGPGPMCAGCDDADLRSCACGGCVTSVIIASAAALSRIASTPAWFMERDCADRRRQGEHDIEIGNWSQFGLACSQPSPTRPMPLSFFCNGEYDRLHIGDPRQASVVASLDMTAERRCDRP